MHTIKSYIYVKTIVKRGGANLYQPTFYCEENSKLRRNSTLKRIIGSTCEREREEILKAPAESSNRVSNTVHNFHIIANFSLFRFN